MSQLLELLHRLQPLAVHPVALVVTFALLAALLEQRIARRRAADFSGAYRSIKGPPPPAPGPRP